MYSKISLILLAALFSSGSGLILRYEQNCPSDGFYRDEMDCGKFYRCTTLPAGSHADSATSAIRYEFHCPAGTVFDQRFSTCNYQYQIDQDDKCANADLPTPAPTMPTPPPFPSGLQPADGNFPVLSPAGSKYNYNNQPKPQQSYYTRVVPNPYRVYV